MKSNKKKLKERKNKLWMELMRKIILNRYWPKTQAKLWRAIRHVKHGNQCSNLLIILIISDNSLLSSVADDDRESLNSFVYLISYEAITVCVLFRWWFFFCFFFRCTNKMLVGKKCLCFFVVCCVITTLKIFDLCCSNYYFWYIHNTYMCINIRFLGKLYFFILFYQFFLKTHSLSAGSLCS